MCGAAGGETLLHNASAKAHESKAHDAAVTALLNAGAKLVKNEDGQTPVDLAMANSHPSIVLILDPTLAKEHGEQSC